MNDQEPPQLPPNVRVPAFDESVYLTAFPDAVKKAIDSADGACGSILTAAFSIATAYGAAIALVTTEDSKPTIVLLLPFIAFAAAAIFAMQGKNAGVSLDTVTSTDEAKAAITSTVITKREASQKSVACLALGIVIAGWVAIESFGQPAVAGPSQMISFTEDGMTRLSSICGEADISEVEGTASTADGVTTVTVTEGSTTCPDVKSFSVPTTDILMISTPR